MDSTTLLYHLLERGNRVKCLSLDYGQRHRKELDYAGRTCQKLGVELEVADISGISALLKGSALTSPEIEVPQGPYELENLMATVVPNRNMIFLAIGGALAVSEEAKLLAIAVHAGDHEVYPDCRPAFIEAMQNALFQGNYHKVQLYAPYLEMSKADIMLEGLRLGIDYDTDTWSCYQGGESPCGLCATCVERNRSLELATRVFRSK